MLEEADIQRFARQILVKEVGGRGQQALLAATVALVGPRGAVLDGAAVWLAAGGSGVQGQGGAPGFPLPPTSAGQATLSVVLLPAGVPPGPAVVVGGPAGGAGAVVAALPTCPACRLRALEAMQPTETPWPDLVASLAALAAQRLLLGLPAAPGVWVSPEGTLGPWSAPVCATH